MTLLLDAAGTLIHPTDPVGEVYARHLKSSSGITIEPARMHAAFLRVFAAADPPDYSLHPFGHAAEHAWWHDLVAAVLTELGGTAAEFASGLATFDSYFESLYSYFSEPSAWTLYSETVEFLRAATRLGPLSVVSNFDDRLPPILHGLGIGPFFKHIFTSADARARKPDRAIFELALDRLNCAPGETYHCGDSHQADFAGAAAAGLHAFHLQRPAQTLFDFLAHCRSR